MNENPKSIQVYTLKNMTFANSKFQETIKLLSSHKKYNQRDVIIGNNTNSNKKKYLIIHILFI